MSGDEATSGGSVARAWEKYRSFLQDQYIDAREAGENPASSVPVHRRIIRTLEKPLLFDQAGALATSSTRDLLRERYGETLDVVIPPPKNAVTRPQSARDPTVRDRHIAQIRSNGRMAWQLGTTSAAG